MYTLNTRTITGTFAPLDGLHQEYASLADAVLAAKARAALTPAEIVVLDARGDLIAVVS